MLTGCASTQPRSSASDAVSQQLKAQHLQQLVTLSQFTLQGRIGVQTNGKGFSGSLQWQHTNLQDSISLFSPLGSQVASIEKTPALVTLTDASNKQYSAANAEALTQETLGWKLPLTGLNDWAIGRPTAHPVQDSIWNAQGQLVYLEQDGWKIEYDHYKRHGAYTLPGKIYLKSDALNLKLVVETWSQLESPVKH